jgi:hypothetical protein
MRFHLWRGLSALRSVRAWCHLARLSGILCIGLLTDSARAGILVFTFEFPAGAGQSTAGDTGDTISPSISSSSPGFMSGNSVPAQLGTGPGGGNSLPGRGSSLPQGNASSGAGGGGLGGGGALHSSGGISSSPNNAGGPYGTDPLGSMNPVPGAFDSGASGGIALDPIAGSPFGTAPAGPGGTNYLSFGNSQEANPDQSGSLDTPGPAVVTPEPFSLLIWAILGLLSLAATWWRGLVGRSWSPACKR